MDKIEESYIENSYSDISVSKIDLENTLKEVVFLNTVTYNTPGIVTDTRINFKLDITNKSIFEKIIYEDEILTKILLHSSTNSILLNHIAESIKEDFESLTSNNKKAKEIYDSINFHIEQLNKDIVDIIAKIG